MLPAAKADSHDRLERLEAKIDALSGELQRVLVGENGDNGLYGRVQALELRDKQLRSVMGYLWGAILSVFGAAVSALLGARINGGGH